MSSETISQQNRPSAVTMAVKRSFDIVLSAIMLVVLAPFLALVAVAVRLDSPGPALFRQERVGLGGKPFRICKFRTMVVNAAAAGTALTVKQDARITRFGGFLRDWKIDELPQLLNVLRGEMSFVGPRPEVPKYMAYYTDRQRDIILSMRPGVTDYAAIMFRNESELLDGKDDPEAVYRNQIMPAKFELYERYSRDTGLLTDLRLMVCTVIVLISPRLLGWFNVEHDPSSVLASSLAAQQSGDFD